MLNFAKIEEVAAGLLNKAPGIAVSIFTGTEVLFQKGFGVTNVEEQGIEITPNTLFRIGSVSKPLTATLIMKLVEKKLLDLDCPIIEYIPNLKLSDPDAVNSITLRMLLSHTSGLPDGGDIFGSREHNALEKYVTEEIPSLAFVAPPNTMYSYGNHSYNLAAFVAEKVTGKRFSVLMNDEIFIPLEMSRSMYDPLKAMTYPLALQHEKTTDGKFKVLHTFPENAACHGSYFCITNAQDMTKFGQMYLNNGIHEGESILDSQTVDEIFTNHGNRFTLPESHIGISWICETVKNITYWWHSGAIGTYRSFMVLFPEQNLGVFTAANNNTGWELVQEIIEQIGSKEEVEQNWIETDTQKINTVSGYYLGSKSGLIQIYLDEGVPFINHNGKCLSLYSLNENHVVGKDANGVVIVSIGLSNNPDYLMVNGSPSKKLHGKVTKLQKESWTQFFGIYEHPHGEFEIHFYQEGEKVFLNDGDDTLTCMYLLENKFFCPGYGLIEFDDDKLTIQKAWDFVKQK